LVAKEANCPVLSPDGKLLYFGGGPERHKKVFRVPVSGGEAEVVLDQSRAEGEYRRISISRDGKWFLLGISYRGIYLAPVEGGKAARLSDGNRPAFCPMEDGREGVVFSAADQNLVRSAIDFAKGKLTGELE